MRIWRPRSLRGRVLGATLVLAAAGLLVANAATYGFLRSFLVGRVDQQLRVAVFPVSRLLEQGVGGGPGFDPGPGPGSGVFPSLQTYGALIDASGRVVVEASFGYEAASGPVPELPAGLLRSSPGAGEPRYLTVPASQGSDDFRVLAWPLANENGTLVVAIPLTETNRTLGRLLAVEALVTVGVLVLLGAAALWLVRVGLRPLERMGETAGAIAAGDLSRRVEPADESTEVGRLGIALNRMLGRIEEAFGRQRASEERLRRFVADASHELRTPVTSIRGYAELFRRGAADRPEDLAKTMARIESEATRMGVLVEDLLMLARMDQGAPLARERVDLADVVTESVEAARAADPSRTIHLQAAGPVWVVGDGLRLRQVLDNVLTNFRIHTPSGTAARVALRADGQAVAEVADEGPGVPADLGDRVFERFIRGDPSRSRERGGAGLGLSIASEIARAHGGTLELVPSERGATFRLTLPLADEPSGSVDGSPG